MNASGAVLFPEFGPDIQGKLSASAMVEPMASGLSGNAPEPGASALLRPFPAAAVPRLAIRGPGALIRAARAGSRAATHCPPNRQAQEMQSRLIPDTDIEVSAVCVGTMLFGTPVGEAGAAAIVDAALDGGANFFDTANMYEGYTRYIGSAGGLSEEFLGKALADRRQEAVIATKVGMAVGPEAGDRGLSAPHMRRECERSLRRLRTDRIDVYYMHTPDEATPIEESIEAMAALIEEGKVRFWGISNFDSGQTKELLAACDAGGWPRPVLHQPQYSLVHRGIETDLMPLCREEGIGLVPYRVLESGLLSGKYEGGIPSGSRAKDNPAWIPQLDDDEIMGQVGKLQKAARERGRSLYEHVLRETVAVPGITSILLGIKSPEQIGQACEVLA